MAFSKKSNLRSAAYTHTFAAHSHSSKFSGPQRYTSQGVRWQKIIEGAICSHDDVTDDVILKDLGKILGEAKAPKPPCQRTP